MRRHIVLCVLAAACILPPAASFSQTFPVKPIRVVIPNEPGTLDFYVRMMGAKLQELTGQPWVIEYRPGAGGQIGANTVARAAPDGYTILFTHPGTHVTAQFLNKTVLYDSVADFTPISALATSWLTVLAHPSVPVNTVAEMIDHVKRNPGKMSYSSTGIGSTAHLSGVQVNVLTGSDLMHIPYKGGGPGLAALIAGDVPLAILSIAGGALPHIKSGKLKILAVMGAGQRYPGLPNVPMISETLPKFEDLPTFIGFFGPAQLPKPIVDRLQGAISQAMKDSALREKVEATGVLVLANKPEEYAAMIKKSITEVGRLVKAAGIKPQE